MSTARQRAAASATGLVVLGAVLACAASGCRDAAPTAEHGTRTFATAERAAWALLAKRADAAPDAPEVLGVAERALLARDGLADAEQLTRLGAAGLSLEYVSENRVFLRLGPAALRVPVPLVRDASGWRFRAPPLAPAATAHARP